MNNNLQAGSKKIRLPLIKKVARQIVDACHPEKIMLFGSHAYGNPNRDSDVDLLIVMKSNKRPADRSIMVYKSMSFYPFPMDIIVRTPQEIRQRMGMGDSFYQEIVSKGKIIYER